MLMSLFENLRDLLLQVVSAATIVVECMGVWILLTSAFREFWHWLKHDPGALPRLIHGISDSLTFLMAAELLKTVVFEEVSEFLPLTITVALRTVMALLAHWELRHAGPEQE